MTSTRLPSLLATSVRSSPEEQQHAKDDLLAWRTVANLVQSLNEQSKGVTWPPPAAPYGTWPREHVAAAKLRVLLTAHEAGPRLATAQKLLETRHELTQLFEVTDLGSWMWEKARVGSSGCPCMNPPPPTKSVIPFERPHGNALCRVPIAMVRLAAMTPVSASSGCLPARAP